MNQNKNRRKNKNKNKKRKKVIRCKTMNKPVFEYEVCSEFSSKVNSNNLKNCENCKHSF
jgi:hypothetical protein